MIRAMMFALSLAALLPIKAANASCILFWRNTYTNQVGSVGGYETEGDCEEASSHLSPWNSMEWRAWCVPAPSERSKRRAACKIDNGYRAIPIDCDHDRSGDEK